MSPFRAHPLGRALATLQAAGLGALAALAGSATLAHEPEPSANVCWMWSESAQSAAAVQAEVHEGTTVGLRVVVEPTTGNRTALADVDAPACR